jgi:hypothetical protein
MSDPPITFPATPTATRPWAALSAARLRVPRTAACPVVLCAAAAERPPSSLSGSSAFPPVVWRLLPDHGCRQLHLEVVAELPQLFRRSVVLKEHLIDAEGVKLAGTVAIDGLCDVGDERPQLGLVVVRDHRTRRMSLRLVGHETEVTEEHGSAAVVSTTRAAAGRASGDGARGGIPAAMDLPGSFPVPPTSSELSLGTWTGLRAVDPGTSVPETTREEAANVGLGWVRGPRYALVMTWILISILAAGIAALVIIPAAMDYQHWTLGRYGVHAPAVVLADEPKGRNHDYLLRIEIPDAPPVQEWTTDVRAGTTVGQRITVIVDPEDPENVQDLRYYDVGGLWLAPLIFLPVAGFFAWLLRGIWRDRPTRRTLTALNAAGVAVTSGVTTTRLRVRDGGVASGYPHPVTFVVALRSRVRMLWGVAICALPLVSTAVSRQRPGPAVLIILGGLAALIAGLFLAFGRNRAILDQTGVKNRWLLGPERRHTWSEITELQNWTGPRSRGIRVVPRNGKPFMLAAPLDAPPGAPDPGFDQKADVIAHYWRDARRGPRGGASDSTHHGRDSRPRKPFRRHGG